MTKAWQFNIGDKVHLTGGRYHARVGTVVDRFEGKFSDWHYYTIDVDGKRFTKIPADMSVLQTSAAEILP
jgi:hypothetical protein